jgi:hypothetical protein
MNYPRILLGGVVSGVIWTIASSLVTLLFGQDFATAIPDNRLAAPSVGLVTFLVTVNLLEGIWAIWLYAAMRPRFGAGPKTALTAGLAWWIISSLVDVTWGSFGFVPDRAIIGPVAASLPAILISSFVGAWLYKE